MAITNAISDLFASIYELFASVFGAIYSILHSFVNAVISFVTGIFTLAGDILQGLVKAVGGLTQFVLGNPSQIPHRKETVCSDHDSQAMSFCWPLAPLGPSSTSAIPRKDRGSPPRLLRARTKTAIFLQL